MIDSGFHSYTSAGKAVYKARSNEMCSPGPSYAYQFIIPKGSKYFYNHMTFEMVSDRIYLSSDKKVK